ncbi:membrane protein [Streptomyces sp. NRRL B-3229]|uniref:SCO2102 family sporulation regulator n=1 Tax=Streptomyces sp. NRRL B-3229 TaxID=1463836 RepID=UPI0004BF534C|nr:membrane protein [Streptomyces sp. NRRL B-3229]
MGWTVLYIAFGFVALWLLGEVLLQYKARLRWRVLAFVGFLGVVAGVLISQVVVIGLGAIAFAVGQTYVTLSFRRGFEQGWAVNPPAALESLTGGKKTRRERGREEAAPEAPEPAAAAYRDETGYDQGLPDTAGYGHNDDYDRDDVFTPTRSATAAETTSVYEPQPLPDDTGSYGVYSDAGYGGDQSYATAGQPQDQYATAAAEQTYGYDGYTGYDQQQYGYDTGGQQYAAYSDPYIGTQTYGTGSYDTSYGGQQQFAQQGYDQYGGTYGGETPAGGVWVPQQRTDEYGGELPQEQQYYQDNSGQGHQGQGQGYDEQYRY